MGLCTESAVNCHMCTKSAGLNPSMAIFLNLEDRNRPWTAVTCERLELFDISYYTHCHGNSKYNRFMLLFAVAWNVKFFYFFMLYFRRVSGSRHYRRYTATAAVMCNLNNKCSGVEYTIWMTFCMSPWFNPATESNCPQNHEKLLGMRHEEL